jgi:DNA-binding CsgD family transcriptional regulator
MEHSTSAPVVNSVVGKTPPPSLTRSAPVRKTVDDKPDGPSQLIRVAEWFLHRELLPIFIIDPSARIKTASRSAQEFLASRSEIVLRNDVLRFRQNEFQLGLTGGICRLLEDNCPAVRFRSSTLTATLLLITPHTDPSPLFAVQIHPISRAELDTATLRARLGLTQAEAQVALHIYSSVSLVQIALKRRVSINTIKSQTRRIFDKCGARSKVAAALRIRQILETDCTSSAERRASRPAPPDRRTNTTRKIP